MTKLELVTREVRRIVTINSADNRMEPVWQGENLSWLGFNTISGRHEIECFFAIEFEQEQVDAWATVQNIIDDVMNLWVSPITDPIVKGANLETVQRLQRQLGESEKAFEERVLSAVKRGDYVAISTTGTDENGKAVVTAVEINPSKSGVVGHVGEEAVMPPFRMEKGQMILNDVALPKQINRIERADVERFAALRARPSSHHDNLLNEYQRIATKSAIYPGKGTPFGLMYAALGLAEAGEVQNKVKKAFRDDHAVTFEDTMTPGVKLCAFEPLTDERRAQIIKELGGVLWYVAAVCDEIGATMSEVALQNLDELCGRGERNTLRGDGDNR